MLSYLQNIEFANPGYLAFLVLIPAILFWEYWKKPQREPIMGYSDLDAIKHIDSWRSRLSFLPKVLRYLSLALIVVALARPQLSLTEEEVNAEGIDIMMSMDLSSSMLAQDFSPDRLSVSKKVAQEFVDGRIHDRVGLVVFAGESYTQCPLTTDHTIVKSFLADLQVGRLQDGTAIGMGLASAVNRLKDSEAKSKVVILLTDGVNNAGYVKPLTAAEIAKEFAVKVYTIGVGSMGIARSPVNRRSDGRYVFGNSKVEIDEALLREISEMTGGKYYRAIDQESLEKIYKEIDLLEKTEMEINVFKRYSDEFRTFLLLALGLLLLEFILSKMILRSIP
jgi:Ca-activated chloride channel family protein